MDLAQHISGDFGDEEIFILGILKGAFVFQADLMRHIRQDCRTDFLREDMDEGNIEFTGGKNIKGKNVILLKDVVHTGVIESYLINQLRRMGPKSIKLACLIDRPSDRKVNLSVDYTLFSAESGIFVGYGMEHNGKYGHLPYIATLEMEE